ncbi:MULTISPECIES: hypothetical protein [unclassified Mesorhizobium]|uniref:hypothetical protein n=2 Tax=Mesorhizobium TaxID=68287 RepID=UPI000FCC194D|nr:MULTISPECIES: hypothetical protein [unclassified Mesorhizobium]RUV44620.1 hypothetical protein EOD29_07590 [Mesorhizobium sp. M1A.T.Ca.IN.004.03.1.1]RWK86770.1 MAG: hypothetical protein EOR52_20805 [Mesorhizobium sp.]TIP21617.1 MAG: hypothetical protein E5X66_02355 [Mesorhizobium sp.]TJV86872.1 MAG: hypothetical protein E5X45_01035 [Mesorhizobium sp.]TJW06593.1 MAG: hypothetical protein E5X42_29150 [Mesorhizobium sp.]
MKTVNIEELLTWAFVHELPKGGGVEGLENPHSAWRMLQASSWGKITSFGELGALIDAGRKDYDNFWIEQGEPHEDAVTVGRAVAALAACEVIKPQGWNGLADWPDTHGLAELYVARAVERYSARSQAQRGEGVVSLVVGTAILGREPDWTAKPARVRLAERGGKPAWFVMKHVIDDNGQAYDIEVHGYDERLKRPAKGAYRKYEFATDPSGDIMGRLDYQIWVAALRRLEAELGPQLIAHRLVSSDRTMTPWLEEDRPGIWLAESTADQRAKKTASVR